MKDKKISNSPKETKKIAGDIFEKAIKEERKNGLVFALTGELGAGKTIFCQAIAKKLDIMEPVLSPTFIIFKKYKIPAKTVNFKHFFHFDCYRIEKEEEVLNLGIKEIVSSGKNIICVEWAEKIKLTLPKDTIWINFSYSKKRNQREVTIEG